MPLFSELPVGSLLIYPTRGNSKASRKAYEFVRYGVKHARPVAITHSIKRLKEILPDSPLEEFWADPGTLVPVPGRAPRVKGGLWVAQRICDELVNKNLATETEPLLERAHPVPRSTGQTKAHLRPTPQTHYDSLSLPTTSLFDAPRKVTLVDDVVTRGATLIACATRIRDAFPSVEIQAFALCRTDNTIDLNDSEDMLAPRLGRVRLEAGTGRPVHQWES